MSDPVTNVAIEDVLSSIRRLVSEDARVRPLATPPATPPAARAGDSDADAASAPEQAAEMTGKLVLTPALRVADTDADTDAEPAPERQHEPVAVARAAHQDKADQFQQHEQHAALHDLAKASDTPITEEITGDAPPEGAADEDGIALADIASDATLASISEALVWEDHHTDASADLSDLAARVAAPAVDAAEDFASGAITADPAIPQQGDTARTGHTEPASAIVFATTRDSSTVDQDPEMAFKAADAASDTGSFDISGSAQAGQDSLFAEDETILDEEMLRELVTDIVRQELQGALGERITRNVRKLVRREIHRALASHDLE
ncbi:MAG: hypothetical protein ACNA7Q_10495 [Rhodobacterales bacterium]